MSQWIVGVDAGGSSTVAVAEGASGATQSSTGAPANLRASGVARAADAIARAAVEACGGEPPCKLYAGVAGIGERQAEIALRSALAERLPSTIIGISDDAHIALRAGAPHGDACALIAGTGAIAYAEVGSTRHRVGGYGYLIGDEGSGFSIGAAAVRLLMRAYDGRVPFDPMLKALATALASTQASDVVARTYAAEYPVRDLAALASTVISYADAGERSATKIVQAAALELFELLKTLVRSSEIGNRAMPLVLAGGLLAQNSMLSYLLETRIANECPHLEPHKGVAAPQFGALLEAKSLPDAT